jgi:hypothetical protein
MTKARVHRIFDTSGRFFDGHAGGYTRRYNPCWRTAKSYVVTFRAPLRGRHRLAEKGLVQL